MTEGELQKRPIEEWTIALGWEMYARNMIPDHVPANDFTRERMHESYLAGAAQIVLMLQALKNLENGDVRRNPLLEKLRAEVDSTALAMMPTATKGN